MTGPTELPQYHELIWPALQAVSELGGSASISEMVETVPKASGVWRVGLVPESELLRRRSPTDHPDWARLGCEV